MHYTPIKQYTTDTQQTSLHSPSHVSVAYPLAHSLRSFTGSAHFASRLYYCSALRASPFSTRFYETRGMLDSVSHKKNLLISPVIDDIYITVIVFKKNIIELQKKNDTRVYTTV